MKKLNNFILHPYPSKTMLLVLIAIIIFFIIPAKTVLASPLPLINVPLDSWVYPAISRLNTLQALEGNDHVAPNTIPLTRLEVAFLIDTVLSNLQKGKVELKDSDLTLMEKLVLEFQDELFSIGVKIIPLNSSEEELLKSFSHNWLYEYLKYFEERDILKTPSSPSSSSFLNHQMSRKDMALLVDEIIYQLQTDQIQIINLTEEDLEKLEDLVIELDDELLTLGLKIVKLNKTTVILDNLKSTLKINPYFTQKADLFYQDKDIEDLKTLNLFSELGVEVSATISENSAFYLDYCADFNYFSGEGEPDFLETQLKQAYIKLKLPSFEIPTPTNTPLFPSLIGIEFPAL
ncbi:MAG TPA: hypothetical protein DHW70_04265, partial [Candidatus Atribacteria bacterium]|nr:hypothetical protein [Candidatus Atribacteria bacterium]